MITSKILLCLFVAATADEVVPQHTESNIHFIETKADTVSELNDTTDTKNIPTSTIIPQPNKLTTDVDNEIIDEPHFIIRLYNSLANAIRRFFESPRVITVFRNIGTCMVNGAMEIVSYYLPAPMIPLVASAAGLIIPFEPVVTLREKMPVTSYRRAFNKAVNSFMGTFDKYKELDVEDPYMTRRFNRRFMNDSPEKTTKKRSREKMLYEE